MYFCNCYKHVFEYFVETYILFVYKLLFSLLIPTVINICKTVIMNSTLHIFLSFVKGEATRQKYVTTNVGNKHLKHRLVSEVRRMMFLAS